MGQEFHVLCCYSCSTFQTHIVKKIRKWECKMCGEKQSVKKVYGQGTAKDCRLHTQKLNELRLNKEEMVIELDHLENDWTEPENSDLGNQNGENTGFFSDNLMPRDQNDSSKIYLGENIKFNPTIDWDIYEGKIFSNNDLCSVQQNMQINISEDCSGHRTLETSFKTKNETHIPNLSSRSKWDKYLQVKEIKPSSLESHGQDKKVKSILNKSRYVPYKHKINKTSDAGLHEYQANLLNYQTIYNESDLKKNKTCSSMLPDMKYNLNTNVLSLTDSTKNINDRSKEKLATFSAPNALLKVADSVNKHVDKCGSIFEQYISNDDIDFEIDL